LATVEPGAHIHSSATIEALATIRRGADIGAHSKVCSGCEIAAGGSVAEWVVVYGQGPGMRRKRARGVKEMSPAVVAAAQVAQTPLPGPAPAGKVIEDARLMVLQKEREVLGRMLVPAAGGRKK
jgi:carbonic anhydrase/acetyltransferase-like protein (isoleucine patch superfamily)